MASGTPVYSVCGILCGQLNSASSNITKKLIKIPIFRRKWVFFGAAGRIRTADLILTKKPSAVLRNTHSYYIVPRSACPARLCKVGASLFVLAHTRSV